jgi:RNA polymerase sigma factor (sigma-70 family)
VPHESGARRVERRVSLPPFQRLVDDHATELHRFLVGCVGADAAEDCLQETFMAALRAYPRLRHGDNLRAWLYTIAHRKATDSIRLRTRRPTVALDYMGPGAEPRTDPTAVPDDGLWIAVRELPTKQREAVVHRYVLDLDYRQIADRMGTSEEAARQNVSAGLRRLRVQVTDR